MGTTSSTYFRNASYTVPLDAKNIIAANGKETCALRSASSPKVLLNTMHNAKMSNGFDILNLGYKLNPNRPYLGSRTLVDGVYGAYRYTTYAEAYEKVKALGTAVTNQKLVNDQIFDDEVYEPAKTLKTIGICSKNREEWFITDFAAHAYGWTSVPLYETLGADSLMYMLTQCQLETIFGSTPNLIALSTTLKSCEGAPKWLKHLISFDDAIEPICESFSEWDITVHRYSDMIASVAGTKLLEPLDLPSGNVATICYTSGTTGLAKGVMITEGAFAAQVVGAFRGPLTGQGLAITCSDVYMSYLPLAHVFERALCMVMTAKGASIAISTGNTADLLDDIKVARPTVFASVPRLYMRINDKIQNNLDKSNSIIRYIFNLALNSKVTNLRRDGTLTHALWDSLIFREIKTIMGGRVRYMLSGGAALEQSIQERIACLFSCPLLEGYGLTETLGASVLRRADDAIYGHIGMNLPMNELKLVSIPEMGYNVDGPSMCGELCFRGHTVFPGYFRNNAETLSVMEDNWFHTGDVAVRLPGCGRIKIVDRKKNIFKLSQGEYVSAEKIENIITQSSVIAQAFVFGQGSKASLIAVIVADAEEGLEIWKSKAGLAGVKNETILTDHYNALYGYIEEEICRLSIEKKLAGFERVKKFHLTFDTFTDLNGLLTPTQKMRRNAIQKQYQKVLAQLYEGLP